MRWDNEKPYLRYGGGCLGLDKPTNTLLVQTLNPQQLLGQLRINTNQPEISVPDEQWEGKGVPMEYDSSEVCKSSEHSPKQADELVMQLPASWGQVDRSVIIDNTNNEQTAEPTSVGKSMPEGRRTSGRGSMSHRNIARRGRPFVSLTFQGSRIFRDPTDPDGIHDTITPHHGGCKRKFADSPGISEGSDSDESENAPGVQGILGGALRSSKRLATLLSIKEFQAGRLVDEQPEDQAEMESNLKLLASRLAESGSRDSSSLTESSKSPSPISIPAPTPASFLLKPITRSELECRHVLHPRHPPSKSVKKYVPPIPRRSGRLLRKDTKDPEIREGQPPILEMKNWNTEQSDSDYSSVSRTGTQEESFLANPLLSPLLSSPPVVPTQLLPTPSESPPHHLENLEVGDMIVDQAVNQESSWDEELCSSSGPVTLSAASTALVELVFRRLNYLAPSAINPRYSTRPVDELLDQFFETSTLPIRPRFDLYLALRQKSAPELRKILAQLPLSEIAGDSSSESGESVSGATPQEKIFSGKINNENIPHSTVDNWDAIVESALWHQERASPVVQGSNATDTTSNASDGSEDVDQLDSDSMDTSLSSSVDAEEIGDDEILIFDGERYVPVDLASTPPQHTSSSTMPTSTSPFPTQVNSSSVEEPEAPRTIQYYEKKTNRADPWGHREAGAWFIYAHGNDSEPVLQPGLAQVPAPSGHPVWCAQNNAPIIKYYFTTEFQGTLDNHPLKIWDNQMLCFSQGSPDPTDPTRRLMEPFVEGSNLIRRTIVQAEDWEGLPDTLPRREVQDKVWRALKVWRSSSKARTQTYSPLNLSQLTSTHRTNKDNPAYWRDQPFGDPTADSFFTDFYPNPYAHSNDSIAFNPWNPQIIALRQARHFINEGLLHLVQHMFTKEVRDEVDDNGEEDDNYHFFYHHCVFFRYMDSTKPVHMQGFSCDCIHRDSSSLIYPKPVRTPMEPRNPLITPEEDEFFHHASYVFESLGMLDLTNALRRVRTAIPFMPKDAAILFQAGYLTPMTQYDSQGAKYPLLWDTPSLLL